MLEWFSSGSLLITMLTYHAWYIHKLINLNQGGGEGALKERMKTNRGRGRVKLISMLTL